MLYYLVRVKNAWKCLKKTRKKKLRFKSEKKKYNKIMKTVQ